MSRKLAFSIFLLGFSAAGIAEADTSYRTGTPITQAAPQVTVPAPIGDAIANTETAIVESLPRETLDYLYASEKQFSVLEEKFFINLKAKSFLEECKEYLCYETVKNMKEMKNIENKCNNSANAFLEAICWGTFHSMKSLFTLKCHELCGEIDEGRTEKPSRKEVQDWLTDYKSKIVGGGKL